MLHLTSRCSAPLPPVKLEPEEEGPEPAAPESLPLPPPPTGPSPPSPPSSPSPSVPCFPQPKGNIRLEQEIHFSSTPSKEDKTESMKSFSFLNISNETEKEESKETRTENTMEQVKIKMEVNEEIDEMVEVQNSKFKREKKNQEKIDKHVKLLEESLIVRKIPIPPTPSTPTKHKQQKRKSEEEHILPNKRTRRLKEDVLSQCKTLKEDAKQTKANNLTTKLPNVSTTITTTPPSITKASSISSTTSSPSLTCFKCSEMFSDRASLYHHYRYTHLHFKAPYIYIRS